jgi:hypothetical protein
MPVMGLELQYLCADTNAMDNQMKPQFQIINNGASPVPLSSLTMHYFYTKDGSLESDQNFVCDYAGMGGNAITDDVTGAFHAFTGTDADEYLEVGFTAGAGDLASSGSVQIQARVYANGYPIFDQTNDYSFDPTKTSFADWTHVTLYQNGTLVWGTEP